MPDEAIGIYASADRSGLVRGGVFERRDRDALKDHVHRGTFATNARDRRRVRGG